MHILFNSYYTLASEQQLVTTLSNQQTDHIFFSDDLELLETL